jgi:hypothetical protein
LEQTVSINPNPDPTAVWIDGDPLMEAIAAAVWERCGRDDVDMPQLTMDDPRTIAAVAASVACQQPAVSVVPPATNQTALREQIAEALVSWTYRGKEPDPGPGILETVRANAYSRADAVLAVLPAPADRAAVLRWAADELGRMDYDTDSHDYGYDTYRDAWNGGVMDGADLLRRLAAVAPHAETPGSVLVCDGCGHLEHQANKCPATRYGERCACDEPQTAPAVVAQPGKENCPAKHGALGRICELPKGHAGMHTGSGPNGGAVWDGDAS